MKGMWAGVALFAAATALSACETVRTARERIVSAPPRCADATVQIYFEPESAEVTDEGRSVLKAAADSARGCKVTSVSVMGLADAAGDPASNLELSKRRADSVSKALSQAGLPPAVFRVSAAGQAGAVTADGRTAPLRRRADVTLHLTAP